MNSNKLKSNKKQKLSVKTIVFWACFLVAVITIIVVLCIKAGSNKTVHSYDGLLNDQAVAGQDIFKQKEDTYLVLFYDFNNRKEMETFDKTIYTYLDYYRDNKNKKDVYKLYAADTDEYANMLCLSDKSNYDGVSLYPGISVEQDESKILKVKEDDLPVLIIITDGKVSDKKIGETTILDYLNGLKK